MWPAPPTRCCASSPSRSSSTRRSARHGARDAAIFEAENLRLSWYDLTSKADELAAGLLALGLRRGDRVGIWAPNRHEWLVTQFATARIGADPRQHQPGLSQERARIRAQQGGLPRAGHGAPLQEQRLPRHAARDRARDRLQGRRARCSTACELPSLKHVILLDDEPCRRAACRTGRCASSAVRRIAAGSTRCAPRSIPTTRSTSSSPAAPPARRRARRCRTSTSSTMRASAPRRWRCRRTTGCAFRCRSTTASAWCWACCAA